MADVLVVFRQPLLTVQYVQYHLVTVEVDRRERESMEATRAVPLPQTHDPPPFDDLRYTPPYRHAVFRSVQFRSDHRMDLVEYRQSAEGGGDGLGYGSGHASAEELLQGLDGARVLPFRRSRRRIRIRIATTVGYQGR